MSAPSRIIKKQRLKTKAKPKRDTLVEKLNKEIQGGAINGSK